MAPVSTRYSYGVPFKVIPKKKAMTGGDHEDPYEIVHLSAPGAIYWKGDLNRIFNH